jgi:ribosomal protein S19E (S16A)
VEEIFRNEFSHLKAHGLLEEDDDTIRLTYKGRFFADEICAQLHDPDYLPYPSEDYVQGPLMLSRRLQEHDGAA